MSRRAVFAVRAELGKRLRALRGQHGFSQEKLGELANLSGKFIGEVERGEKSISIDSLWHVAKALEVPLAELTDLGSDRKSDDARKERERIRVLVGALPEDQLRLAKTVLKAYFSESKPRRAPRRRKR